MGRRYDLALMILGRRAPQFRARPQFASARSLRRIVARFGEKAHCPVRRGGHLLFSPEATLPAEAILVRITTNAIVAIERWRTNLIHMTLKRSRAPSTIRPRVCRPSGSPF